MEETSIEGGAHIEEASIEGVHKGDISQRSA